LDGYQIHCIEDAFDCIYDFMADMECCKFNDSDDVIYDLAIFAAECLENEIYSCPQLTPIEVTLSFLDRLEQYASKGNECDWVFRIYADAIKNIYDFYFY